jgi:hypothetical protein
VQSIHCQQWKVILFETFVLSCTYVCTDPQVLPLHSLEVVNVAATKVTENEMLAHALENVTCSDTATSWVVKQGSDFVNEYPWRDSNGHLSNGSSENPNHLLGSFPCLFLYGLGGFEVNYLVDDPLDVFL